ncbi:MAG: T9SS type A sorting domain-containing protein [Saprospiraceae bacterium]|nr:T9SS type A sorting domain-containing protein [Saprospiraceae bacterium]
MKKIKFAIAILSILLQVYQVTAQNIPIQSLTSGGATLSSGSYSLNVSLGQIAVNTLSTTNVLTQGFQQANHFTITEINIVQLLGIKLFPNPATNYIVCEMGNQELGKVYSWSITNNLGQMLNKGVVEYDKAQIDISSLPSGNYYFYIQSSKNEYGSIKFVKTE